MDYSALKDFVWVSMGGIAAVAVFNVGNIIHSYYREKHPKEPEAVFIDPRNSFEKSMNNLDYDRRDGYIYSELAEKHVKCCPWPNPNPDTIIGRFATRNDFYKLEN